MQAIHKVIYVFSFLNRKQSLINERKRGGEKEVEIKRSLRNKGKEYQKIEEMAKIRAEERDNYDKDPVPEFVNSSLLQISSITTRENLIHRILAATRYKKRRYCYQ